MKLKSLCLVLALAGCEMTGADGPDAGGMPDAPPIGPNFTSLYANYLDDCAECHAPGAPGRTSDIEQTLDFSTKGTAYNTLKTGTATGLMGSRMGCNTVPFLDALPARSLLLAVLDQPTRNAFDLAAHPDCDEAAITDETARLGLGGPPSAAYIQALKDWITAGAPNN
jgi:hypothetical protein